MILILLKSLLLGFLFTLPLGPIGVLCVRRILQFGRLYGFLLGISQVFVVLIYSIIAILSMDFLTEFFAKYPFWIRLSAGLVLMGFGIKIFLTKSSVTTKKDVSKKRFIADFFSIIGLMLISPHTLLIFLAFFAVLGLYEASTVIKHIEVVFGILLGSLFSWALVCVCFAGYKTKTTQKVMTWINRSVGILLAGFGIVVCISAI
jgi:threonine/homoserine/homoserine lactone efflux protein